MNRATSHRWIVGRCRRISGAIARMRGSGRVVLWHRGSVDQVRIGSPIGRQTRVALA